MKNETRLEGTIYRHNGLHWVKEDQINMPVESACSYLFFKYGSKGTIATKLITRFAFEWEQANAEMDLLLAKKKQKKTITETEEVKYGIER
jgi:hypothetical protein